ncbi:MAG: hypothetical protein AAF368_04035 [Planctomycetota bacterium]
MNLSHPLTKSVLPLAALLGLTLLLSAAPVQEASPPDPEPNQEGPRSTSAEELRGRIHDMRMNVLLGGDDAVKRAEQEAIQFYGEKSEVGETRLDSLQAERTEKRTTYDLRLDQALSADTPSSRAKAMEEASSLRRQLDELEQESVDLTEKRTRLSSLVSAVESRDREREKLAAKIETSRTLESDFGLPSLGIGLAPDVAVATEAGSSLANDGLIADLMERDPIAARQLLYEADPQGYWKRFPLRPPGEALRAVMRFPLPDLPGRR